MKLVRLRLSNFRSFGPVASSSRATPSGSAKFTLVWLMDDFSGSGNTCIRFDSKQGRFKGKIKKIYERLHQGDLIASHSHPALLRCRLTMPGLVTLVSRCRFTGIDLRRDFGSLVRIISARISQASGLDSSQYWSSR